MELDFRHVDLPQGPTEVRCRCFLGGAKIIVPEDLYVEVDGFAILGAFDEKERETPPPPPAKDDPWLHITGLCILGNVEVAVVSETDPLPEKNALP